MGQRRPRHRNAHHRARALARRGVDEDEGAVEDADHDQLVDALRLGVDLPGEGFNDPTPVEPVGQNPGVTLGEQRLIVFQFAADLWGSLLESDVEIVGKGPRFTLRQLSLDDFPTLDEGAGGGIEVDGEALATAVGQVAVAAAWLK